LIRDTITAIKRLISDRALAYRRTFDIKNPSAKIVILDLAKFCRAHQSTFHEDSRIHAALEGRKEVWLRIQEHLNLTDEELMELHKVKYTPKG
jgi:hypothetical protein